MTIGVWATNSGDNEEGDIESRDDDEVNQKELWTNYLRLQTPKDKISPKTSERNDLESETFIARETKRERDISL